MKINFLETKYLSVDSFRVDLEFDEKLIETCEDYTNLGVKISKEGSSRKEISYRINRAKQAINKLMSLLWSNNIQKQTKLRIYQTILQSML